MIEFPIQHKLFNTSIDTWQSMIEDIKRAKHTIDFEQFYFTADTASKDFTDALIEKARAGVKIRCHFDSAGAFNFSGSRIFKEMTAAGIEIKFFNWLIPFTKGFQKFTFFRNHRRLLLIDIDSEEPIAYNGGICFGESVKKWDDLNVKLFISIGAKNEIPPLPTITDISHPLASMKKSFEDMWSRSESSKVSWTNIDMGQLRKSIKKYKTEIVDSVEEKEKLFNPESRLPFMYATQSPLPGKHHLYRALITKISKAVKHITITTPYFLPTHRIMRKLLAARRRGVLVTIIIPQKTDHPLVDIGSHTYMNYFLDNKIDIYRHPKMIHGKAFEIDGNWAMVGTMNLDTISLRYNFESGIVSGDEKFVTDVEKNLNKLREESKQLTSKDWEKRGLSERIAEVIIWPFRKLL